MEEIFLPLGVIFALCLGSCVGCVNGENDMYHKNQKKMIELNLAHFNQKTGEYVQDSLSCKNDSCVIIRKKSN